MFSSFNFLKINFVAISSFAILYTRLHDYSGNLPEYLLKVKSWNTNGVRQTKSQHTQSMIKIRGMAVQKLSSVTLKRKTKACFGDLRTILKTLLLTTAILLLLIIITIIIVNSIINNITIMPSSPWSSSSPSFWQLCLWPDSSHVPLVGLHRPSTLSRRTKSPLANHHHRQHYYH